MNTRWLHERDQSRSAGDKLARAVQAHLRGETVDLAAALVEYGIDDGPAWAEPGDDPSKPYLISRYCWRNHRTAIVSEHHDRAEAEREFTRLRREEIARIADAKARGVTPPRPLHLDLIRRAERVGEVPQSIAPKVH